MEFEVNNDLCSKVSPFQGDIIKFNVDVIMNLVNNTLIGGGSIYGVIHEAARPGLIYEYQKLTGCEIGECKAANTRSN